MLLQMPSRYELIPPSRLSQKPRLLDEETEEFELRGTLARSHCKEGMVKPGFKVRYFGSKMLLPAKRCRLPPRFCFNNGNCHL